MSAQQAPAGCSFDWRSNRGDPYRSGASCFARAQWTPATAASFTLLPATARFSAFISLDPLLGIAAFQTRALDVIAVNVSTGAVVWQTYNISGSGGADGLRAPGGPPPPPPHWLELTGSGSDGLSAPPHHAKFSSHNLLSGAADARRGLVWLQDRSLVYVLAGATGAPLQPPLDLGLAVAGAPLVTLAPSAALPPAPAPACAAIVTASVFAPTPGVVAHAVLSGVSFPGTATVPGALTLLWQWTPSPLRSSCSPPAFTSDSAATAYVWCTLDDTSPAASSPTVFALEALTGAVLWATPLDPNGTLGRMGGGQRLSTLLLDSTGSRGTLYVATNNLTDPTSGTPLPPALFTLRLADGALLSTAPLPSDGGFNGFTGTIVAFRDLVSGAVTSIVGATPRGSLVAVDPLTATVQWALPLPVPPPGPGQGGVVSVGPLSLDARTRTLWLLATAGGGGSNGTTSPGSAYVGAQVSNDGTFAALVFSNASFVFGQPGSGVPAVQPPPPGGPNPDGSSTVTVLTVSSAATLEAAAVTVLPLKAAGAARDNEAAAATAQYLWTAAGRGAVMGTPAIITNPANASQATLVYVGYDDGTIRALEAGSGALLWASDLSAGLGLPSLFAPPFAYNSVVGIWSQDLLLVGDWAGNLYRVSLRSGALVAVIPAGDAIAEALAPAAPGGPGGNTRHFFGAPTDITLLDEPAGGAGLSLIMGMVSVGFGPSFLCKLLLPPVPPPAAFEGPRQPPSPSPPVFAWNFTSPPGGGGFSQTFVVAALGPPPVRPPFTQLRVLVAAPAYSGGPFALDADAGTLLWTAPTPLLPGLPASLRVTGLAGAARTDSVYATLTSPAQPQPLGFVARLTLGSGAVVWAVPLCVAAGYGRGLAVNPGTEAAVYVVCANAASAPTGGGRGRVVALRVADGAVLWWAGGAASDTMAGAPSFLLAPTGAASAHAAGLVLYGTSGGGLVAVDASDGSVVAAATLPGAAPPIPWSALNLFPGFTFAPVVDGDSVLVAAGGDDGYAVQAALPGLGPVPPAPPASPSPSRAPGGGFAGPGLSAGATAAVVLGGLGGAAALAGAGVFLYRRRALAFSYSSGGILVSGMHAAPLSSEEAGSGVAWTALSAEEAVPTA